MTALLNTFNDTLIRLKKQIQANRFLRWWLAELSAMMPGWMHSAELTLDHYVLVPLDQVDAQMRKPDVASPRVAAITLSGGQVLRRTITLPLATQENLHQVLEFQMEQYTPFPAGKLYFGHSIVSRDFTAGQLTVEFVATPRAAVDSAIKTLLDSGVEVRAVFLDELVAAGNLLNLLPATQGSALSPLRYGANPWLAGLVAILLLAALAMPLVIKREAVVQLLPAVDKGKKAAAVVTTVREELDRRVAQHNFLLEKRQMTPPVIQMLEELTHILPDDTWVSVFDLKGKVLTIEGETSTATSTKLIGLFEHSSMFSDAGFGSPLFKGQAADTSRYKLAIKLRPPANAASTPAPPGQAASAVSAASVASAVAAVLAVSKPSAPTSTPTASQPVAGKTP